MFSSGPGRELRGGTSLSETRTVLLARRDKLLDDHSMNGFPPGEWRCLPPFIAHDSPTNIQSALKLLRVWD